MHNVLTSSDSLDSSPPVQYSKSISIIEHFHYNTSFVRWLFSSGPLKSKEVSITDTYNLHSHDFPQLAQEDVTGFVKRDLFDRFFKIEFSSHSSATGIALNEMG